MLLNSLKIGLGTALLSATPRLVGATYRYADACDPRLQQRGSTPAPEIVLRRETISVGLAALFSFMAALATHRLANHAARFGKFMSALAASAIGNILAEGVARVLAYRNLGPKMQIASPSSPLALLPPAMPPAMPMTASPLPPLPVSAVRPGFGNTLNSGAPVLPAVPPSATAPLPPIPPVNSVFRVPRPYWNAR